jgi:hypothetical protein
MVTIRWVVHAQVHTNTLTALPYRREIELNTEVGGNGDVWVLRDLADRAAEVAQQVSFVISDVLLFESG